MQVGQRYVCQTNVVIEVRCAHQNRIVLGGTHQYQRLQACRNEHVIPAYIDVCSSSGAREPSISRRYTLSVYRSVGTYRCDD